MCLLEIAKLESHWKRLKSVLESDMGVTSFCRLRKRIVFGFED